MRLSCHGDGTLFITSLNCYFHFARKEDDVMCTIEDVIDVVCVGSIMATFLLNSYHGKNALELSKECLILLDNIAGKLVPDKEFIEVLYKKVYRTLFLASCIIQDHTKAAQYGRKLLVIHNECGERANECNISRALASIYLHQSKYLDAKELYERAFSIIEETGIAAERADV